jgi:hypothetical protein
MFIEHGKNFAGIDATHNTTQYENVSLFTVMVRDRWGHGESIKSTLLRLGIEAKLGMPAAWMISSNAQEETMTYFLRTIQANNPGIVPRQWMSDKDRGQLNSVQRVYPDSRLFLCWWHVLHAWQQHFVTQHHQDLWKLLKEWIRITNQDEFDRHWVKICEIAPPSVVQYLQKEWLNETAMWSAVARKDRTIFELGDTNMLVEA